MSLTLIEDGSERDMHLPYALAFQLHSELDHVAHKRRLLPTCTGASAALRLLFFELGTLQASRAWAPARGDRIIALCERHDVGVELAAMPYVQVIDPSAIVAVDELWRDRELRLVAESSPPPLLLLLPAPPSEQEENDHADREEDLGGVGGNGVRATQAGAVAEAHNAAARTTLPDLL